MKYIRNKTEQPSCVLICGKIDFFDEDVLKRISRYYRVVFVQESGSTRQYTEKPSKDIHMYVEDIASENFERIMQAYLPDAVWMVSGFIDNGDGLVDEQKKIDALIRDCAACDVKKFVYVSSEKSLSYTLGQDNDTLERHYLDEKGLECFELEELVKFSANRNSIKSVILRVPFIYNNENKDNYLGDVFDHIGNGGLVGFPYDKAERIDFLSIKDIGELLVAVTEETMDESGEYLASSGYELTLRDFSDALSKCKAGSSFSYTDDVFYDLHADRGAENQRLRKEYGFIPSDNIIDKIKDIYLLHEQKPLLKSGFFERLKNLYVGRPYGLYAILEMVILFIVVQLLIRNTTDMVTFKYVDLRLFFVLVMGTAHGMLVGFLSGVLQCISLAYAYMHKGVNATMLFYNMDYWLAFAIYLMTGTITGYLSSTKNQKIEYTEKELQKLQDKYVFLDDVYMSVINNKDEYKKQILGYQDSFGKIFEVVQNLNSSNPGDIFKNSIETMEKVLDNHSIAIYVVDKHQKYGRLAACSREMLSRLSKSLSIDNMQDLYEVIKNRDTWKNTSFREGVPVYAYGIVEKETVRCLICICDANIEQMSLYYMNLFTIICHLIRVSFKRALEYQTAIETEKYYEDTYVLKSEYFEEELKTQRDMQDAGMTNFVLLKIVGDNILGTYEKLGSLIRQTDMIGIGSDGTNYLLLTQMDMSSFEIIANRLNKNGVEYQVVEGM